MKEQLLTTLENSRNYTLAVLKAMPEANYHSQPIKEMMSFSELLNHIAYGIIWWKENVILGKETDWEPPKTKNQEDTVNYLNQAYDTLSKTVEKAEVNDNFLNAFHSTMDHVTHHRGQAVLHLRYNSITPPEYVF